MNTDDDADHRWAARLLARAVDTEPELGFTPEDVLSRARRDLTLRRSALTGALTIAVLVTTGLLLGQSGAPQSHTDHGVPAATRPAVTATTETTVPGAENLLVLNAHAGALTAELAGARLIPPDVTPSMDKSYGGQPLVFYKLINGQFANSYYAQATLTDPHGAGHLVVQVLNQQTGINCIGISDPRVCHTQTLPDGNRITVRRYTSAVPDKPTIQWQVELVRPDGTAVDALCGNWSLNRDPATGEIAHATGAEPPLSKDTLVQLVQLPGLTP
jgi:hypothetical protein